MAILPISVSLLADQLPRIFLIFSIFSVKLLSILAGLDVENPASNLGQPTFHIRFLTKRREPFTRETKIWLEG